MWYVVMCCMQCCMSVSAVFAVCGSAVSRRYIDVLLLLYV